MLYQDQNQYYFAKGKIRYKGEWITIDVPHGLTNYYRWWVEKFLWKKTSTSYHSPHITCLAGKHEKGLDKHPQWGKYDGQEVEFKYYTKIHTDAPWFFKGQYFWLQVECPLVSKIRTELGLKPNLKWPLHTTICYCGY